MDSLPSEDIHISDFHLAHLLQTTDSPFAPQDEIDDLGANKAIATDREGEDFGDAETTPGAILFNEDQESHVCMQLVRLLLLIL